MNYTGASWDLGTTAFMEAAHRGHDKCVQLLIDAGADVNIQCKKSKRTALMRAVLEGHAKCVGIIVAEEGADVNIRDINGHTAIMLATQDRHDKFAGIFRSVGAEIIIDKDLEGPSAVAVDNKDKLLNVLINAGADVNIADCERKTPLHSVIETFSTATTMDIVKRIKILFRAGASVNKMTKEGECALQLYAKASIGRNDQFKVVALLFAAGERLRVSDHLERVTKINLRVFCRRIIRNHLLEIDWHENLFIRVPKLGLPAALESYLLYDQALGDEE